MNSIDNAIAQTFDDIDNLVELLPLVAKAVAFEHPRALTIAKAWIRARMAVDAVVASLGARGEILKEALQALDHETRIGCDPFLDLPLGDDPKLVEAADAFPETVWAKLIVPKSS